MEDVLDLYAEAQDPLRPCVCFDECPYQLLSETRRAVPVKPGRAARYDYEYRREGTCNLFVFVQLHAGWPFPTLLPKEWSVATFYEIFTRRGFPLAMWNTVWVAAAVTGVQALTSSATGYVFAKYHFPFKEALFKILLATMMIPFVVIMIPLYVQVYQIKLVDNLWALVVIGLWSTFGLFTMRSFIESIPTELIEAARIDGASEFWIYGRVVMPLALAPLVTISVFTFLAQWDNFLFPSVLINSMDKQTLPLFLNGLRSIYWTRYDLWITGSLLTVLPVLIAYAFSQRTFVRGAQTSGLKG